MAKVHKSIPRGNFGKGTQIYKDAITGMKQGMKKSLLSRARKLITAQVNQEIDAIHYVKVTDDQIIFLDEKHEVIKAMKA